MDGGNPRVWKWMVPALFIPCILAAQLLINSQAEAWMQYFVFGSVFVMVILLVQAIAMFRAYYAEIWTNQFVERRNALSTTSETRLFEMARMMHPETVKLLLMHRKVKWRIKESHINEMVDWVLDADPRIRVEFVEYVLKNSTQWAMMPKHGYLSDKAHEFDPDHLVTDYQQYDAFHQLLINRAIATDAFGNQPGQWIEPWMPELVARQFGISLEEAPMPPSAEAAFPQISPKGGEYLGEENKKKGE